MYKGITKNSKDVKNDFIYCCFEGTQVSGYDFIDEAIENGASKIIGRRSIDLDIYEQVVDVNEAMSKYAKQIYDNPQDKLDLIGITGTDGKTSSALIVDYLLNKISKSSYLGTNGFFIQGEEIDYSGFTTPFADKLYEYFKQSVQKDNKYFTMEVSSHALKQKRVSGLKYKVGIFTNLSAEHLDFHKTIEDYYLSKRILFDKLDTNGYAIVNIDDEYGKRLSDELNKNIITISNINKDADFYFDNEKLTLKNTTFDLHVDNQIYKIDSPLLAKFNIYNLVEAIATIKALGYDIANINELIKDLSIAGRLEVVKNDKKLNIIIDFAHTADAIDKVMNFIKSKNINGNIHVLTGSAGQRDKQKRPLMGENAAKNADFLYLTEDDPRDESVMNIINDLKKGIKNCSCKVIEQEDRKKAIKQMIENAKENDTLVLFGKGAMKVMYYDKFTEEYIEKEVVKKILNEV